VGQRNQESRIRLEIRVGVNTGEAVAGSGEGGQFLVTGTPVNAASRLQSAAEPGEILAGMLTVRLTRGAVRYSDAWTITAKGLGTLECCRAKELRSPLPEARRSESLLRAPLIGREDELRALEDAFAGARESRRARLVTIL